MAKKIKTKVKKTAPNKVTTKKSSSAKKQAKKTISKKAAVRKPVAKKSTAKKKVVKKTNSQKTVAKKTTSKKVAVKKVAAKKTVSKKAAAVKAPIKKSATKKPAVKQKPAAAVPKPVLPALPAALPAPEQHALLPEPAIIPIEVLIEKVIKEDPIHIFDKHVYQKATAKGDPHKKLYFNNKSKKAKMPSNKKPLWRK
ncbi:MAG: histone H1-like repetitive region-containing protein [Ferruginibacter sp.]|nr:histone H1-like repetitive region-containing protein [Ferruginibacter sp.]